MLDDVLQHAEGHGADVRAYQRRLRDVMAEMAGAMQVELEQLMPGGLAVARQLVQNGYLLPSSVAAS